MKGAVHNRANLAEERLAALQSEIGALETLEDIFRWARSTGRHDGTEDLIVQDEYTHDAIFPYDDGLFLVFGVT